MPSQAGTKVAKATAEAERWQVEAKSREAHSRARIGAIDATERILAKGVKASDLPHWWIIIEKAGVTAERLASALERYGNLEKIIGEHSSKVAQLRRNTTNLKSQVDSLRHERDNVSSAIAAIRDGALREVQIAGTHTLTLGLKETAIVTCLAGVLSELKSVISTS